MRDADEAAETPPTPLSLRLQRRIGAEPPQSENLLLSSSPEAEGSAELGVRLLNVANRRYALNFDNPFSGTHFGSPRRFGVDLRASLR